MNKAAYFYNQSQFYMNNKFYHDAVSRRYYALFHLMVDVIEQYTNDYNRHHDAIRIKFQEFYQQTEPGNIDSFISEAYQARCNADYTREKSKQFTDRKFILKYRKITNLIQRICKDTGIDTVFELDDKN